MNGSIPLYSGEKVGHLPKSCGGRLPGLRPVVFSEVVFLSYSHPATHVYVLECSSLPPNHLIGYTLK